jgi:phosphomannomutase
MALVLSLMARTGKTVSDLVAEIPAYAIEKRKVDLARKEDAVPAIQRLRDFYSSPRSSPPHRPTDSSSHPRIDLQDGVRLDWDGPLPGCSNAKAWLHVRASNTEPIMRLIAEAPTGEAAKAILDDAARIIA